MPMQVIDLFIVHCLLGNALHTYWLNILCSITTDYSKKIYLLKDDEMVS